MALEGNTTFAGADWLRACRITEISPLGERVADLMGELYDGIYHWDTARQVDWANTHHIRGTIGNDLATHDFNMLTRLVLLAHREQIRVSIAPCNFHRLEVLFHDRGTPNLHGTHPHPTIEEAVARFNASR